MKAITADLDRLNWRYIADGRYELTAGEHLYAAMRCNGPYKLNAEVLTASESLAIRCLFLLQSRFSVHSASQDRDIAFFVPSGSEHYVLQLVDGAVYTWQPASSTGKMLRLHSAWCWTDAEGNWLARITPNTRGWLGSFEREATVEIQPGTPAVDHLALLVVLGWYVMLMRYDDEQTVLSEVLMTISAVNM